MKHRSALTLLLLLTTGATHAGTDLVCEVNPIAVGANGYQLEVYLTNTGGGTIHNWSVILNFSEQARITGSWNARVTETTLDTVYASNGNWNGKLLPGQTTSFGLQGDYQGSFAPPGCTIN